ALEQRLLILRSHDGLGRIRGDGDERKRDGGSQQLHTSSPWIGLVFLGSGAPRRMPRDYSTAARSVDPAVARRRTGRRCSRVAQADYGNKYVSIGASAPVV